jgi:hypothetical protein
MLGQGVKVFFGFVFKCMRVHFDLHAGTYGKSFLPDEVQLSSLQQELQ